MRTFLKTSFLACAIGVLGSTLIAYAPDDAPVDLRPLMSAVKSQGDRNTCNSFAATAMMEFLIKQETGKDIDLSESYAYWLGRNDALDTDDLRKRYLNIDALPGFVAVRAFEFGCMDERDWPYESKNWDQLKDPRARDANGRPVPERFTGTPPNHFRTVPYRLKPILIDKGQIADFILREKKPVLMNVMWCQDAVNNRTGEIRMPTEAELKKAMGHVVLLVGFDPKTRVFTFRNSWGEAWGNQGYGTIPEQYILDYYEVRMFEPIEQHDEETQKFLKTVMKGVSGELVRH